MAETQDKSQNEEADIGLIKKGISKSKSSLKKLFRKNRKRRRSSSSSGSGFSIGTIGSSSSRSTSTSASASVSLSPSVGPNSGGSESEDKNVHQTKRRRTDGPVPESGSDADTSSSSEHELDSKPEPKSKPEARVKTQEELDFEKRERELDARVPEQYRKYRPKGYPFNPPPEGRPIRIYADGVFDLFHLGHMKQLEQCKRAFPNVTLICGIPSDEVTHKLKGLTVLSDKERCETLRHCRWVDEVVPNAPWCVTPEFLEEHKIDYVAHDDIPYVSADSDDIYKPIKEMGKFLTTQRTDGISTSDIITKIIRDYDKYLMRNFARGATRQELNVSWLKKNELEFKRHIEDFRSYFKKNQEALNSTSKDLYFEVREVLLRKTLGNKLYRKLLETGDGPPQFARKLMETGKVLKRRRIKSGEPISSASSGSSTRDRHGHRHKHRDVDTETGTEDDYEDGSDENFVRDESVFMGSGSPVTEFAIRYTGEGKVTPRKDKQ